MRKVQRLLACSLALAWVCSDAHAQLCGVDPRIPCAESALPLSSVLDVALVRTHPNVALDQPLQIVSPPDGTGRLFVVEEPGRIRILPDNPWSARATTFLDLSKSVVTEGAEGLLGLAFDPAYASNRRFYVSYIAQRADCQDLDPCFKLARFQTRNGKPNHADPDSRVELLEVLRNETIHNGGMLAFGPDGMLYVAVGEDGGGRAQDLTRLTGKLLRIDVSGASYAIPEDNPFSNEGGLRGEIWAYGLRNPWRFSFDADTGDLWIGDAGEASWE